MPHPLIEALRAGSCYDHACDPIEVVETHLSWVLLTGPYAYKIKKPVDFGFADFSTLERRKRCCELELELNRQLAPQLYRDVVAITGTEAAPRIGGAGPVLEYAVRMVQFPQRLLATHPLKAGGLAARHFDRLAHDVAGFHERCPRALADCGYDATAAAAQALGDTFAELLEQPGLATRRHQVEALARWSARRFPEIEDVLRRRQAQGHVRECHGDLHLGNLVLLDDRLLPFDRIEFNPTLRWIDTASEIAFTVMDLLRREAPAPAWRFLNAYLEESGDYGALAVLDWFLAGRALVRAKVAGLRAQQCAHGSRARAEALLEARGYLALALGFTRRTRPLLVITHGVAGSGKSTLAAALVEARGMIRIRSDVERKRLFGLAPAARSGSGPGQGLYERGATARTYRVLEQRAGEILHAGHGAVVDATFLQREQRAAFAELARRRGARFCIVACDAPADVLERRVATRRGDASEATPAVLAAQLETREPLGAGEGRSIAVDTSRADATRQMLRALAARPAIVRASVPVDAGQCRPGSRA